MVWNFKHLGSESEKILSAYNQKYGLKTPILLSPAELNAKEDL
jgi:hypothetical protein